MASTEQNVRNTSSTRTWRMICELHGSWMNVKSSLLLLEPPAFWRQTSRTTLRNPRIPNCGGDPAKGHQGNHHYYEKGPQPYRTLKRDVGVSPWLGPPTSLESIFRGNKSWTLSERPFSYKICNKAFTRKGGLVIHEHIHIFKTHFQVRWDFKKMFEIYEMFNFSEMHTV